MKFIVRLKAQFCTDDKYSFNSQITSHIKGDGSFYASDIFIVDDDLSNCRIKALNILKEWEKAVVSNDEKITAQMENFIQSAIKSVQMEQKCYVTLDKEFEGTSINYVQLMADEFIQCK